MFLGFGCPFCGSLDSCGRGTVLQCAGCAHRWSPTADVRPARRELRRRTARQDGGAAVIALSRAAA